MNDADRFTALSDRVAARLEKGRETYGDRSFDRPPDELVDEVEEELLDVAGWGFILWCRMESLRARIGARATSLSATFAARRTSSSPST